MYETEKNRMKVCRYRTRKGLKEAGYTLDEITEILGGVDWAVTTPIEILSAYTGVEPRTVPRTPRGTQEEYTHEGGSLPLWVIVAATALLGVVFALPTLLARTSRG